LNLDITLGLTAAKLQTRGSRTVWTQCLILELTEQTAESLFPRWHKIKKATGVVHRTVPLDCAPEISAWVTRRPPNSKLRAPLFCASGVLSRFQTTGLPRKYTFDPIRGCLPSARTIIWETIIYPTRGMVYLLSAECNVIALHDKHDQDQGT